jgi:hypothetical protein
VPRYCDVVFRRKPPPWVCAWQDTGLHVTLQGPRQTMLGPSAALYARRGEGETHAVATSGSQSEAVCGQIVRYVGKDAWPPSFGDECADCARLTVGGGAAPKPSATA